MFREADALLITQGGSAPYLPVEVERFEEHTMPSTLPPRCSSSSQQWRWASRPGPSGCSTPAREHTQALTGQTITAGRSAHEPVLSMALL